MAQPHLPWLRGGRPIDFGSSSPPDWSQELILSHSANISVLAAVAIRKLQKPSFWNFPVFKLRNRFLIAVFLKNATNNISKSTGYSFHFCKPMCKKNMACCAAWKKMKNDRMSQHQWHQNSVNETSTSLEPNFKKASSQKKHKQLLCEYVGYWMHVFKANSVGTCVNKQDSVLPLCPYQMSFWNLPWFTSSPLTLFFDDGASLNLNDSDTRQYQKYPKTNNWIGPADLKIWKKFGFFSVLQIVYLTNGCPTPKTDFISLLEVFVGNDFLRKDWKNIDSPVKGFVQTNVYPQVDKL